MFDISSMFKIADDKGITTSNLDVGDRVFEIIVTRYDKKEWEEKIKINKELKNLIGSYIIWKRKMGYKEVSALDFSQDLRIPMTVIERVMDDFVKDDKIKEVK